MFTLIIIKNLYKLNINLMIESCRKLSNDIELSKVINFQILSFNSILLLNNIVSIIFDSHGLR